MDTSKLQVLNVRVEFWGVAARLVGKSELSLSLPAGATVADVAQRLAELQGLAQELPNCAFAVGDEIVRSSHPLTSGDVVGILPPVSGG